MKIEILLKNIVHINTSSAQLGYHDFQEWCPAWFPIYTSG